MAEPGTKRPATGGPSFRGKRPRRGGPPFGGGRGMPPPHMMDDPFMWDVCPPFPGNDMPPEEEFFDMCGGGFRPPPPFPMDFDFMDRGRGRRGRGLSSQFDKMSLEAGRGMRGGPRGMDYRGRPQFGRPFRGRGARGGFPQHPYDDVNPEEMLIAEKIRRFAEYLKTMEPKSNAIQTIENAVTGSRLNLKTIFDTEELLKIDGKPMYTGYLSINGVFLHRSIAANKKELKHEIYKKSLDILQTKSIVEILSVQDVGVDVIRQELQSSIDANAAKTALQRMNDASQKPVSATVKKLFKIHNKGADFYSGLERLQAYLKTVHMTGQMPQNNVQALEQAFTASHSGLDRAYEPQTYRRAGKLSFSGKLLLNGVPVAQGKASKKKECKLDCYTNAVHFILDKLVGEIIKGIKIEEEPELMEEDVPAISTKKSMESLDDKLGAMIAYVTGTELKEDMVNMTAVDVMAMNIGLYPTVVFKKEDETISCDLYLDNVFITTGSGEGDKEAEIDVYTSAWEIIGKSLTHELLENRQLKPEDLKDKTIFKVNRKGWAKRNDSNMLGLLRRNRPNQDMVWKHPDSVVIVEHNHWSSDRMKNAFNILNYSANINGMLIEWKWIQLPPNLFNCQMAINQVDVGSGISTSKQMAKQAAAVDTLFQLYETQQVVRLDHENENDPKRWVAFEEIKKLAVRMEQANPAFRKEYLDAKMKDERFADRQRLDQLKYEKMLAEGADVKPETPIDPYIIKVCMKLVDDMANKETLDDLIIGPGMSRNDKREISAYVRQTNRLRLENRDNDGEHYFSIFRKYAPLEYVEMLRAGATPSSRVRLLRKDECPKRSDAEEHLKKLEIGGIGISMEVNSLPGRKGPKKNGVPEGGKPQISGPEVTSFDD